MQVYSHIFSWRTSEVKLECLKYLYIKASRVGELVIHATSKTDSMGVEEDGRGAGRGGWFDRIDTSWRETHGNGLRVRPVGDSKGDMQSPLDQCEA